MVFIKSTTILMSANELRRFSTIDDSKLIVTYFSAGHDLSLEQLFEGGHKGILRALLI